MVNHFVVERIQRQLKLEVRLGEAICALQLRSRILDLRQEVRLHSRPEVSEPGGVSTQLGQVLTTA